MKSEIDTYRECVEHLMSSGSCKPVSNGLPQHAAVLFETFFKHARESVKIFCHHLDSEVFESPRVIEAAADALKRGVAVDIIVQEAPQSPEFLKRLSILDAKESIRMELLSEGSKYSQMIADLPQNFAVMDSRAYRLERDSNVMKATASMNAPQLARRLRTLFNLLRASYNSPEPGKPEANIVVA